MIDKVLYLCNRQRNCASSSMCGWLCKHTSDEAFAKNEPANRRFRSEVKGNVDGVLVFTDWEVEQMDMLFLFGKDEEVTQNDR